MLTVDPMRAAIDAMGREGVITPPMPRTLKALPDWVRHCHQLFAEGAIPVDMLAQCRKSAITFGDVHRAMADVRKSEAAMESAQAQTRMAEVLAAFEHGGPAVAMLARLTEGMGSKRSRRIPGRAVKAIEAEGRPA